MNLSERTKPIQPKAIEIRPITSDAALAGLAKAEPVRREFVSGLEVNCWGYNDGGQIGDGSKTTRPSRMPTIRSQ